MQKELACLKIFSAIFSNSSNTASSIFIFSISTSWNRLGLCQKWSPLKIKAPIDYSSSLKRFEIISIFNSFRPASIVRSSRIDWLTVNQLYMWCLMPTFYINIWSSWFKFWKFNMQLDSKITCTFKMSIYVGDL